MCGAPGTSSWQLSCRVRVFVDLMSLILMGLAHVQGTPVTVPPVQGIPDRLHSRDMQTPRSIRRS